MKVKVNQELCTGCGLCVESCPEAFEMDGDKAKSKSEDIAQELAQNCKKAASECPVEAISVEEKP